MAKSCDFYPIFTPFLGVFFGWNEANFIENSSKFHFWKKFFSEKISNFWKFLKKWKNRFFWKNPKNRIFGIFWPFFWHFSSKIAVKIRWEFSGFYEIAKGAAICGNQEIRHDIDCSRWKLQGSVFNLIRKKTAKMSKKWLKIG